MLLGEVGTSFNYLRPTERGYLDWSLLVSYNYDFDADGNDIDYSYEGAPTSLFSINDRVISAGSLMLGGGFAYTRGHSTFSVDYRGQANSDYRQQIFGARLSYEFD